MKKEKEYKEEKQYVENVENYQQFIEFAIFKSIKNLKKTLTITTINSFPINKNNYNDNNYIDNNNNNSNPKLSIKEIFAYQLIDNFVMNTQVSACTQNNGNFHSLINGITNQLNGLVNCIASIGIISGNAKRTETLKFPFN